MSINRLSDHAVPGTRLTQLFEMAWPVLEAKINDIPRDELSGKRNRPTHEVLEDLVAGIRNLELRFRDSLDDSSRSKRRRSAFHPMLLEEMLHGLSLGRRDPMRFLRAALDRHPPRRDPKSRPGRRNGANRTEKHRSNSGFCDNNLTQKGQ